MAMHAVRRARTQGYTTCKKALQCVLIAVKEGPTPCRPTNSRQSNDAPRAPRVAPSRDQEEASWTPRQTGHSCAQRRPFTDPRRAVRALSRMHHRRHPSRSRSAEAPRTRSAAGTTPWQPLRSNTAPCPLLPLISTHYRVRCIINVPKRSIGVTFIRIN